ncbi:MAG TPA: recombinase family protein [Nocardioidaceae bacterium]|nr:recombinase family protein [Nocardioidaceae bacterium]
MHVGLYTRVSTHGQVDGESLPEQERNGRAWAEANGHTVVAVYTDAGRSGALPVTERPGLADALEAMETGVIDGLVMRDLDRLAREVTVQEAVLAQVWLTPGASVFEYGRNGEVLRDDPDDPMRTAMRQMAGVFAGLERRVIVKRLRDGRRAKARKGEHANGPAPYGWVSRDGDLYPVPVELAVLDEMRRLRATGAKQADVAAALNAAGHPARSGGAWTQPVVSRVLARDAARTPEQVAYQAARLAEYTAPVA